MSAQFSTPEVQIKHELLKETMKFPPQRVTFRFRSLTPAAIPVHVLLSTGGRGGSVCHSPPVCPALPSWDLRPLYIYITHAKADCNTFRAQRCHTARQPMFNYCAQHPLECCMIAPLREAIWYCTLHREPKAIAHSREEDLVNRMQSTYGEGEGRS